MASETTPRPLALDAYTCREFLADAAAPDQMPGFFRSLMMVAWAAGYAAAHDRGTLRADNEALELIAVTLGDVARRTPDRLATEAIAEFIDHFVERRAANT